MSQVAPGIRQRRSGRLVLLPFSRCLEGSEHGKTVQISVRVRATEAARATLLANEWAQKQVIATLVGDVATDYFQLRQLDLSWTFPNEHWHRGRIPYN